MTLVIEDCKVILSDDGGVVSINVEDETSPDDVLSTSATALMLDEHQVHPVEPFFERHGEER